MGLGLPCACWAAAPAGVSEARSQDAESAVRKALGLEGGPAKRPDEAAVPAPPPVSLSEMAVSRPRPAASAVKARDARLRPGVNWDPAVLGLRNAAGKAPTPQPGSGIATASSQSDEADRIRVVLGFDIAPSAQRIAIAHASHRATEALLTTPVAPLVADAIVASTGASADRVDSIEAAADSIEPQLAFVDRQASSGIPLQAFGVESLLSQKRRPQRKHDEPLPMFVETTPSPARREEGPASQALIVPMPELGRLLDLQMQAQRVRGFDSGEAARKGVDAREDEDPLQPFLRALAARDVLNDLVLVPLGSMTARSASSEATSAQVFDRVAADMQRLSHAPMLVDREALPVFDRQPLLARIDAPDEIAPAQMQAITLPITAVVDRPPIASLVDVPRFEDRQLQPLLPRVPLSEFAGAVDHLLLPVIVVPATIDEPSPFAVQPKHSSLVAALPVAPTFTASASMTPSVPSSIVTADSAPPQSTQGEPASLAPQDVAAWDIFAEPEPASSRIHAIAMRISPDWFDIFDPALPASRIGVVASALKASNAAIPPLVPVGKSTLLPVFDTALTQFVDLDLKKPRARASSSSKRVMNDAPATPADVVIEVPRAAEPTKTLASTARTTTVIEAMERKRGSAPTPSMDRNDSGVAASGPAAPDPLGTAASYDRIDPLEGMRVAVSEAKLDGMRGGFEGDSGLRISFGIERAVFINGNLVTTTSLNVADLGKISAGQAQAAGLDRATLGLIQNGPNNNFAPGNLSSSSVATVIQNSLNDQKIQGVTLINATVNSLDVIRRTNVQSSIQSALTDSLRR